MPILSLSDIHRANYKRGMFSIIHYKIYIMTNLTIEEKNFILTNIFELRRNLLLQKIESSLALNKNNLKEFAYIDDYVRYCRGLFNTVLAESLTQQIKENNAY